jgi:hypothetical protein
MTSTDEILSLVQVALNEFEDRPLEATLRRTVRIASLLGESQTAIRLALELSPLGGDRTANAEDARRLLSDPETWGSPSGPAEQAFESFLKDRAHPSAKLGSPMEGKVLAHSIGELAFWDDLFAELGATGSEATPDLAVRKAQHEIVLRTRHRCFTALCQWERQLSYANVNERIFARFQGDVDKLLGLVAPDVLSQFSSVHRRLREASASEPAMNASEELTQALTTCRRILEAVADHVWPRDRPAFEDGTVADPSQYRARLKAFVREHTSGETYRDTLTAEISGLEGRFRALDKLGSKAVHASVALAEAEVCAISTYVLAGELLRMYRSKDDEEPTTRSQNGS